MIVLIPYQTQWPAEFLRIGQGLPQALGDLAVRIDHIGSTAVPGLAAKDIIDIQITVLAFDPTIQQVLRSTGYDHIERITGDHIPPGSVDRADDWAKWIFIPPPDQRGAHIHVRLAGRPNQRYPLLFRDYLRTHLASAQAYAQVKSALAKHHSDDHEAYYDIKDPVCDVIMGAAEAWAASINWEPGPSDC